MVKRLILPFVLLFIFATSLATTNSAEAAKQTAKGKTFTQAEI